MLKTAEDIDAAAQKFEARKLTQDGYIWPVARHLMRHGPTIRERMRADFQLAAIGYGARLEALPDFGWSPDQVAVHGQRALAACLSELPTFTPPRGEFATFSEVKAGDRLIADGGFTCITEGKVCEVEADTGGLFVRCDDGQHYLDGQITDDGRLSGLWFFRAK